MFCVGQELDLMLNSGSVATLDIPQVHVTASTSTQVQFYRFSDF